MTNDSEASQPDISNQFPSLGCQRIAALQFSGICETWDTHIALLSLMTLRCRPVKGRVPHQMAESCLHSGHA